MENKEQYNQASEDFMFNFEEEYEKLDRKEQEKVQQGDYGFIWDRAWNNTDYTKHLDVESKEYEELCNDLEIDIKNFLKRVKKEHVVCENCGFIQEVFISHDDCAHCGVFNEFKII